MPKQNLKPRPSIKTATFAQPTLATFQKSVKVKEKIQDINKLFDTCDELDKDSKPSIAKMSGRRLTKIVDTIEAK